MYIDIYIYMYMYVYINRNHPLIHADFTQMHLQNSCVSPRCTMVAHHVGRAPHGGRRPLQSAPFAGHRNSAGSSRKLSGAASDEIPREIQGKYSVYIYIYVYIYI